MPVINYKKLKKESDARGGGAGGTSPTRGGRGGNNNEDPFAGNAAIDARMGGGGPPAAAPGGPPGRPQDKLPGGGGNHMAEVIRRIEGFYSAPRFQDSDDDDDDDDEADGAARPENDAASESDGEEDMVDDGRDPNDPAVIEDKKRKAAMRAAAKAAKKAKQQTKGGQVYEEWYDMDDDFIDDDELDEYFERTGRTDKLGGKGGDRFYVNAGAIEFVDDGTGHAQAEAAARRRAKKLGMNVAGGDGATGGPGGAGGSEWTERDVDALKRGVAKHGRRWRTIKHDAEFEGWFKQFSMGAMRHKWRIMAKRGLVSDGGDDKVGTPAAPVGVAAQRGNQLRAVIRGTRRGGGEASRGLGGGGGGGEGRRRREHHAQLRLGRQRQLVRAAERGDRSRPRRRRAGRCAAEDGRRALAAALGRDDRRARGCRESRQGGLRVAHVSARFDGGDDGVPGAVLLARDAGTEHEQGGEEVQRRRGAAARRGARARERPRNRRLTGIGGTGTRGDG